MADDEDYYSCGDEEHRQYYEDDVDEDDDGRDVESEYEPDSVEIIQAEQKPPYIIFTEEDIHRRQQADIAEITSVLALSAAEAGVILRYYDWDVEKAKDAWFGDERGVRAKVGLFDTAVVDEFFTPMSTEVGKLISCGICFDSNPKSMLTSVSCGHLFCSTCWKIYISRRIVHDGPGCLSLRCPSPSCKAIVDGDMVNSNSEISNDLKAKYSRYFLRSYAENGKKMKWCPAPSCDHAIEHESILGTDNYDVTCNCTHFFCWNCLEEAHRPVDCATMVKWATKKNAEAENTEWIIANTKNCPQCKRPIEKNDGCMHMTCAAPCKHEFCWLCLGSWATHNKCDGDLYSCNHYEKLKKAGKYEQIKAAEEMSLKSELHRFIHHYERWLANYKSRQNALKRLQEMKDFGVSELRQRYSYQSDAELHFIIQSWKQIAQCRRILLLSYVYGYYIAQEEKEKKNYFDCLQGQAEHALERFHRCVEDAVKHRFDGESTKESFDKFKFRTKVTGLGMLTKNYFDNLSRAMKNGLSMLTEKDHKYTTMQLEEIRDARIRDARSPTTQVSKYILNSTSWTG